MSRDPRYWEHVIHYEHTEWFWSPTLVSDIICNISEPRFPSTPFLYRIEDRRRGGAILDAIVTVRDERNGQLLAQPHSSAIVPLGSFASTSILPKLHSLPNIRRLVIEVPRNCALYNCHEPSLLNNIRHFLGFFGMLTDGNTYYNTNTRLIAEYTETLPTLHGHTLSSIVLPLDLRDGLDDILQNLAHHRGLFTIKFTSPTIFRGAAVHPSVLASCICPSLQLLQRLRKITIPADLVCVELLYTFAALHNLAEISIAPDLNGIGHGGLQFVELALDYNYTSQHFPALRRLDIGAQRIRSSRLSELLARFPGVRIS